MPARNRRYVLAASAGVVCRSISDVQANHDPRHQSTRSRQVGEPYKDWIISVCGCAMSITQRPTLCSVLRHAQVAQAPDERNRADRHERRTPAVGPGEDAGRLALERQHVERTTGSEHERRAG